MLGRGGGGQEARSGMRAEHRGADAEERAHLQAAGRTK